MRYEAETFSGLDYLTRTLIVEYDTGYYWTQKFMSNSKSIQEFSICTYKMENWGFYVPMVARREVSFEKVEATNFFKKKVGFFAWAIAIRHCQDPSFLCIFFFSTWEEEQERKFSLCSLKYWLSVLLLIVKWSIMHPWISFSNGRLWSC